MQDALRLFRSVTLLEFAPLFEELDLLPVQYFQSFTTGGDEFVDIHALDFKGLGEEQLDVFFCPVVFGLDHAEDVLPDGAVADQFGVLVHDLQVG